MDIINGKVYKHFKGGCVLVLSVAKHSDREEKLVIYKGLNNGKIYARPIESFIETVVNENGESVTRFSLATERESMQYVSADDQKVVDTMVNYLETTPER